MKNDNPKEATKEEEKKPDTKEKTEPETKKEAEKKQKELTELQEKLRSLNAPLEVQFSQELHDFLQSAFSPHFERAFMLFEKDGIVCKAVESTDENSSRSFSFIVGHVREIVKAMEEEGYEYVGTYHHHLDSDEEVAFRKNPVDQTAWRIGEKYDPIHPSPDDIGVFKSIGFTLGDEDEETKKIQEKVKYLFLGNDSASKSYRMRGYTMLRQMPPEHPWNRYQYALAKHGFMLDHYRGEKGILNHPLKFIKTGDNDVEANKILQKKNLENRKYEGIFENETGSSEIRVFTKKKKIWMVEIIANGIAKRFTFDEQGNMHSRTDFADNRTKLGTSKTKWIDKKRYTEETEWLQQNFGQLIQELTGQEAGSN